MVTLATGFVATFVYPLDRLDVAALGAGWKKGPLPIDVGVSRTGFYPDKTQVEELLAPARRWHCAPSIETPQLVVDAAELIAHPERDWSEIVGHLVLHLRSSDGAAAAQSFTDLGDVARPRRSASAELRSRLPSAEAFDVDDSLRVGGILLSGHPGDDEKGQVRWPGREPMEGRLTDLVVLRKDSATVSRPFQLDFDHPTPSYLLTASGSTVAIGRWRPLRGTDTRRLRTTWLDAYFLELLQFEELQALAAVLRRGAIDDWQLVAGAFRRYRTRQTWPAASDHPMEASVSRRLRRELGTADLVARVQSELDDHNLARQVRSADQLNLMILLLTVATVVVPLLLEGRAGTDPLTVLAWVVGGLAVAGVLAWVALDLRRR